MNSRRVFARSLALAVCLGGLAEAHPLDEGTARITLRDNHFDVVAEWDIFALVDATPTVVATCDEATLARLHDGLRRRIEAETSLRVDGARLPLALTAAPDRTEFRVLAAQLSAADEDHGLRARLRLESPQAVRTARHVSLRAPAALGAVVMSFVQPASRYVRPGGDGEFEVLERPRGVARSVEAPRERGGAGASTILALVAGIAGYVVGARVRASGDS